MKKDRAIYKLLNEIVSSSPEDKDPNDYIYGSLTQPPLKVVNKHNIDDEMKWDVECPNCGQVVNYGEEIFMMSGHHYCIHKGCREKLTKNLKEGVSK